MYQQEGTYGRLFFLLLLLLLVRLRIIILSDLLSKYTDYRLPSTVSGVPDIVYTLAINHAF